MHAVRCGGPQRGLDALARPHTGLQVGRSLGGSEDSTGVHNSRGPPILQPKEGTLAQGSLLEVVLARSFCGAWGVVGGSRACAGRGSSGSGGQRAQ